MEGRVHWKGLLSRDEAVGSMGSGAGFAQVLLHSLLAVICFLAPAAACRAADFAAQQLPVVHAHGVLWSDRLLASLKYFLFAHRAAVLFIGLVFLLQLFLIAGLWITVTRSRRTHLTEHSTLLRDQRAILDNLPLGIAYFDVDSRILSANRFLCDFLGHREEEIVGRCCHEILGDGEIRTRCASCPQGESIRHGRSVIAIRPIAGRIMRVVTLPEMNEQGEVCRFLEVFEDITEQARVDVALAESEQKFRMLVESSLVGICIICNGEIIYKNPEQERIMGPLPATFRFEDFAGIHPDDREKVRQLYKYISSGSSEMLEGDFRFYRLGKVASRPHMRWVFCRLRRFLHQGQDAILVSMIDITRPKELEHLVSIQDKMSSLGRVAAGIAHEIRNPLSGINIYLNTLQKIYDNNEDSERVGEIISHLQSASNKIESVIRRVMDFAKPSTPSFAALDVNQPVLEAIHLSKAALRKQGIVLEHAVQAGLPAIHADSQQLEQVVLNLMGNAAEAMREQATARRLRVVTLREKDQVLIRVSDSGTGVPQELRTQIFDPFFTNKHSSTGIGLSLCSRIVADHGGSLEVADSPWGGADFVVRLPVDWRKEP